MSRIGKQNLNIPSGTKVSFEGDIFSVIGPKGELKKEFKKDLIKIKISEEGITSEPLRNDKFSKSLWGTYMSHIENMIKGVNDGFEKKLVIDGVGFKWEVKGDKLQLNIGYSHPVFLNIPNTVTVTAEKSNLTVSGLNIEDVSLFAMQVRRLKPVEPFNGKGIRYVDEVVIRKQGKKAS